MFKEPDLLDLLKIIMGTYIVRSIKITIYVYKMDEV